MIDRVIGLDLSLNSAGIARLHVARKGWDSKAVTSGNCPADPIWKRFSAVAKDVLKLVGKNDIVFIEDYAFGKRSSLTVLAELGGIVRFMIWRLTGHWPFSVPITALKKFATGRGSAKKEDIKLALYKKHRLEFKTNDEADALVLAQIGALLLGFGCPIPERENRKWYGYEQDTVLSLRRGVLKSRSDELQALAKDLVWRTSY